MTINFNNGRRRRSRWKAIKGWLVFALVIALMILFGDDFRRHIWHPISFFLIGGDVAKWTEANRFIMPEDGIVGMIDIVCVVEALGRAIVPAALIAIYVSFSGESKNHLAEVILYIPIIAILILIFELIGL